MSLVRFVHHLSKRCIGKKEFLIYPRRNLSTEVPSTQPPPADDNDSNSKSYESLPSREEEAFPKKTDTEEERYKRYRREIYRVNTFAEAWENVWESKETPFDLNQANPVLQPALEKKGMKFKSIIVPGSGSGYNLLVLAKSNPRCCVTGVEIATGAVVRAGDVISKAYGAREVPESDIDLVLGDLFDDSSWKIIFDYTPKFADTIEGIEDRKANDEKTVNSPEINEFSKLEPAIGGNSLGEAGPYATGDINGDSSSSGTTDDSPKTSETSNPATDNIRDSAEVSNNIDDVDDSSNSKTNAGDDLGLKEPEIDSSDLPKIKSQEEIRDILLRLKGETSEQGKKAGEDEEIGYDLIVDHGFFSSFPPHLRKKCAERIVELATPDTGRLLTIMHPVDDAGCRDTADGPPFHTTINDYKEAFEPFGMIMEDEPYESPHSIPSRKGKELICWWKRGEPFEEKPKRRKNDDWDEDDEE